MVRLASSEGRFYLGAVPNCAATCLDHVLFSGIEPPRDGTRRAIRPGTRTPPGARSGFTAGTSRERADPAPLHPLVQWLLEQAGVNAQAYRPDSLLRRLPACLRHLRVSCPISARDLLQRRPELIPDALSSVLIGVTDFFRDDAVFHCLRHTVMPELLRTRATVRVYSAGVSSGKELYSVAMLLAEMGALERSHFLGLDCRPDAIAQAGRGEFETSELDRVDAGLREKYFHRRGSRWIAAAALRSRMEWRQDDLFNFHESAGRDLILFRNVAIYLDAEHAAAVWRRLATHLAPGGFLVAGRAEQPPPSLPLRRVAPSVYRLL